MVILLAGVLTAISLRAAVSSRADENAVMPANQVIQDEGYGNTDAEYFNSEDDRVNDEEASDYQKTGNDTH